MACAVSAQMVVWRAAPLQAADFGSGLESVHLRHLAIHQDQIVNRLADGRDRLRAVRDHVRLQAGLFEQPHHDHLIDGVVFSQQDPGNALRGGRSRLLPLLPNGNCRRRLARGSGRNGAVMPKPATIRFRSAVETGFGKHAAKPFPKLRVLGRTASVFGT